MSKTPGKPKIKRLGDTGKNLKPYQIRKGEISREEAARRGSIGGKRSVEVRRKKKLLSEMYKDFLLKDHKIKINGKMVSITSNELIDDAVRKTLRTGTMATVGMLKEIADRTEGPSGRGGEGSKADMDLLGALLGAPRDNKDTEEKKDEETETD